jgi:uncharacterized protein (TIGR03066 family)
MNVLKYLSVAVVVCLIGSTARSEDKPDYAKLIVGKWEVTNDDGPIPVGVIVEFIKDGKLKATFKMGNNSETTEGRYSLEGNKLGIKGVLFDSVITITILKISDTEMSTRDEKGNEFKMKRLK